MDLAVLRAEIDGDAELAALVAAGLDADAAAVLNAASSSIRLPRRLLIEDLLAFVAPDEMPSPGAAGRSYLDLLITQRVVLLSAEMLGNLAVVFGADSKTMTKINAAATRDGSRAEALFGEPVSQDAVSACYADERKAIYDEAQAPLNAKKADLDVAIAAFLRAEPNERAVRETAVRAAQDAVKAEHEKGGVVFDVSEAPSVIELGGLR